MSIGSGELVPVVTMEDQPSESQRAVVSRSKVNQNNEGVPERVSSLANVLSCLSTPFFCCFGGVSVWPSYETIVTRWGIPKEVLKVSGYYTYNQIGLETHEVFMGNLVARVKKIAVNDLHGNPIHLSAQYIYCITDSLKAHYAMRSLADFVQKQAIAALFKVAGNFPYDSSRNIPRLCIHSDQIDSDLKRTLNSLIEDVGLRVVSFKIMSIAIDTNMQKLLLAKQEAQAYITGRKKTAESAFQIAKETVEALSAQNILLTEQQRNALVSDLLYMICDPDSSRLDFYRIKDE